ITFHSDLKTCDFKFISSEDSQKTQYGFKVVNETSKVKNLDPLVSTTEVCSLKKDTQVFI
ncbi:hypothetical protein, partial [Flavobacterium lindanitolerans]|uniref:hypothetical protein n=1 Tax=Flavobacterium lindanitolerans TaxID=428988 RepID=UPI002807685B